MQDYVKHKILAQWAGDHKDIMVLLFVQRAFIHGSDRCETKRMPISTGVHLFQRGPFLALLPGVDPNLDERTRSKVIKSKKGLRYIFPLNILKLKNGSFLGSL